MPTPTHVAFSNPRIPPWRDWIGRAPSRILFLFRNARHVERLIREPQAIGPESAASLVHTVNLVIEHRCNIRCNCCHYFKAYDEIGDRKLNLAQMIKLVDEVPNASVAITGGEPLMSPTQVVEAARMLLQRRRSVTLVTNSLPLVEKHRGEFVREMLLGGLALSERAKLRIRCSVDLEHQAGGRLSVEEYVARCHAGIGFLTSAGFPVFTRSIVTTPREYEFFREYVLPLATSGVTRGASVQPNMYGLPAFSAALQNGKLGDIETRLGTPYVNRILNHVAPDSGTLADIGTSALRTAPWVLVEINARGVKGPSAFLSATAHHSSVVEMLRSYDWLAIADAIVPQITITKNALLYRINRQTRSVSLNLSYLLNRLLQYGVGLSSR